MIINLLRISVVRDSPTFLTQKHEIMHNKNPLTQSKARNIPQPRLLLCGPDVLANGRDRRSHWSGASTPPRRSGK